MSSLVPVSPVYGWGWLSGDGLRRPTPLPFQVKRVPGDRQTALVVCPEHEFDRGIVEITQRGSSATAVCAIAVKFPDEVRFLATGYAVCDWLQEGLDCS